MTLRQHEMEKRLNLRKAMREKSTMRYTVCDENGAIVEDENRVIPSKNQRENEYQRWDWEIHIEPFQFQGEDGFKAEFKIQATRYLFLTRRVNEYSNNYEVAIVPKKSANKKSSGN